MKTFSANKMVEQVGSHEASTRVLWRCGTPFLGENNQLVPATRRQFLDIINDPSDVKDLELKLAALVDGGSHFVTATYYLEGDEPLIFTFYERLATVAHSVTVNAHPNLEGVARQQANGNLPLYNQLVTRTKACITPGLHFFQRKFSQEFHGLVRALKDYAAQFRYNSSVKCCICGRTPKLQFSRC